jgi:hypothetical protein
MGLLFHLKSRPGCLEELGISPSSNWAELLGLPTLSSFTVSLPINEHPIHVQPDLKLATKDFGLIVVGCGPLGLLPIHSFKEHPIHVQPDLKLAAKDFSLLVVGCGPLGSLPIHSFSTPI